MHKKRFFLFLTLCLVLFSQPALGQVAKDSTDLVLSDSSRIEVYFSNQLAQEVRLKQTNLIGYSNELIDLGNGGTKWNLKFDRSSVRFLDEIKIDISSSKGSRNYKVFTENFIIDFADAVAQGFGVSISFANGVSTITINKIARLGDSVTIDPTIIDTGFQPTINYGNVTVRHSTANIWTVFSKNVSSSNKDIFVSVSNDNGATFTTFNLTNTSDFNEALPHIDINSTGGLVISYDKYFTSTANRQTFVTTCQIGVSGTKCTVAPDFLADINVSQCALGTNCGNNSLSFDQNNYAHLVYGSGGTVLAYRRNTSYVGLVANWSAQENIITTGGILFNNTNGSPDGTGVLVAKNGSNKKLAFASSNGGQLWLSYYNGTVWHAGFQVTDPGLLANGNINTPPAGFAGYDENFYIAWAQANGSDGTNEQIHFRQCKVDANCSTLANWSVDLNVSNRGLNKELVSIMQSIDLNLYIITSQFPSSSPLTIDANLHLYTRLPNGAFTTSKIADGNLLYNDANFLFNPILRANDINGGTIRNSGALPPGNYSKRLDYVFLTSNTVTMNPHVFVFDSNTLGQFDVNGIIASFTSSISSPLTLDVGSGISNRRVDFNSTTAFIGIIDSNYSWFVNNIEVSTSQNYSRDFNGANADYNISLIVNGRSSITHYKSQVDLNYLVRNLTQNIDINFSNNNFNKNVDINLGVTATGTINYVVWGGTDFDVNRTGNPIRRDYNANGVKQVCVIVNGVGDINSFYCENFVASRVLVKRPLDEVSLAVLTPFSVSTNDSVFQIYSAQTLDLNVFIFNAQGRDQNVLFTIDFNNSYYSAYYLIQTNATSTFHTLQPLLTLVATSVAPVFHVINSVNQKSVPDIIIEARQGTTLIGSTITDSTGSATLTFIAGDTYEILVKQLDGTILLSSTLRPVDLEYFIYVFLEDIVTQPTSPKLVNISFNPLTGEVLEDSDGNIALSQTVSIENNTITYINIQVDHNGAILFDQNYFSAATFSRDYNVSLLDLNYSINVKVTVVSQLGTTIERASYFINPRAGVPDFLSVLNSFGVMLGQVGRLVFVVLSAFVVTGGFVGVSKNKHVLVAVVLIWLGIFTSIGLNPNYVEWVPVPVFLFAVLGGIAFYLNK